MWLHFRTELYSFTDAGEVLPGDEPVVIRIVRTQWKVVERSFRTVSIDGPQFEVKIMMVFAFFKYDGLVSISLQLRGSVNVLVLGNIEL